jgi:hypothetical protein
MGIVKISEEIHEQVRKAFKALDRSLNLKKKMINQGSRQVMHLEDDWTVVTKDGKISA